MEPPLVEPLPLTEREEVEVVVVVRHDGELGVDRLPVHAEIHAATIAGEQEQRPQLGEDVPPPPVALATMDEEGIEPQRDVVQKESFADAAHVDPALAAAKRVERADWIFPVEAQIAREVVPRAERDADEREVALERRFGDRCKRAVAPRDPQRVGLGRPRELGGVIGGLEDPRVDSPRARLLQEFLRARAPVARARVDVEQSYASTGSRPSERSSAALGWAPIAAAAGSPSLNKTMAGIDAIP